MKKFSKNEYLAIYLGWTFLHLIFLTIGWKGNSHSVFWPFGDRHNTIGRCYNILEFLIYVGTPAVAFFIHRLIKDEGKE